MAYAVFQTGGKQYRVAVGDVVEVEKIEAEEGKDVSFGEVLMVSGDAGVNVGTPLISGASVTANVLGEGKEKKVIIYKFKSKKGFHKKKGHRQPFTSVKIVSVNA